MTAGAGAGRGVTGRGAAGIGAGAGAISGVPKACATAAWICAARWRCASLAEGRTTTWTRGAAATGCGPGGPPDRGCGWGGWAPCICLRALEAMLLTTPTSSSTTQTKMPTSRTAGDYFGVGPVSGGGCCCASVAASVEAPIDPRISVSACTFLRR